MYNTINAIYVYRLLINFNVDNDYLNKNPELYGSPGQKILSTPEQIEKRKKKTHKNKKTLISDI